jgi:hypothetical protein
MINDKNHTASLVDTQEALAAYGIRIAMYELRSGINALRSGYDVIWMVFAALEPKGKLAMVAAPFWGPESKPHPKHEDKRIAAFAIPPDAAAKAKQIYHLSPGTHTQTAPRICYRLLERVREHIKPEWIKKWGEGYGSWPVYYRDVIGKKIVPADISGTPTTFAWQRKLVKDAIAYAKLNKPTAATRTAEKRIKQQAREQAKALKKVRADEMRSAKAMEAQAKRYENEANKASRKLDAKKQKITHEQWKELYNHKLQVLDLAKQLRQQAKNLRQDTTNEYIGPSWSDSSVAKFEKQIRDKAKAAPWA